MYICITESLCCTAEISTTSQINCTSIKQIKKTNYLKKNRHPLAPNPKDSKLTIHFIVFFPQRTNAHAVCQAQEFLGLRGVACVARVRSAASSSHPHWFS